jgi:predicted small lipoprotein YifL|tara:strand:- start:519 stop:686 length:168 start_codon:yes stop_codon:yes gene_type:complete
MSEKINHAHSKALKYVLAIPFLIIVTSCGNKGPLTVPQEKMENPIEQQESENNSY